MELTHLEKEPLGAMDEMALVGERPVDVPEKFWDSDAAEIRVDALLHSYQALEKKLSERFDANGRDAQDDRDDRDNADFAVSEAEKTALSEDPDALDAFDALDESEPLPDYAIMLDHDMFEVDSALNERLREAGFSETQAQLVYDLAAEELMPVAAEIAGVLQSEVDDRRLEAHFGGAEIWRETQRQLKAWGAANLPNDAFESLASTYEGVQTLHRLMQGSEPKIVRLGGGTASVSAGELRRMIRDPRYWRDRDPAFVREVTAGYENMYPEQV